jgi:hypothetical protein
VTVWIHGIVILIFGRDTTIWNLIPITQQVKKMGLADCCVKNLRATSAAIFTSLAAATVIAMVAMNSTNWWTYYVTADIPGKGSAVMIAVNQVGLSSFSVYSAGGGDNLWVPSCDAAHGLDGLETFCVKLTKDAATPFYALVYIAIALVCPVIFFSLLHMSETDDHKGKYVMIGLGWLSFALYAIAVILYMSRVPSQDDFKDLVNRNFPLDVAAFQNASYQSGPAASFISVMVAGALWLISAIQFSFVGYYAGTNTSGARLPVDSERRPLQSKFYMA